MTDQMVNDLAKHAAGRAGQALYDAMRLCETPEQMGELAMRFSACVFSEAAGCYLRATGQPPPRAQDIRMFAKTVTKAVGDAAQLMESGRVRAAEKAEG